jgi:hypothetical protein
MLLVARPVGGRWVSDTIRKGYSTIENPQRRKKTTGNKGIVLIIYVKEAKLYCTALSKNAKYILRTIL